MKTKIIQDVVELLQSLIDDEDSGKVFRERTAAIVSLLNSNAELAVEKALLELEELNTLDLSSYHRTQVWDVVSLLESIKR
ncbi:UPF0147 family protein [Candidatus Woesearchaeota archaeon]|nr:UPF0147 family protein [Candidatus Woesearchaeota archaeon]